MKNLIALPLPSLRLSQANDLPLENGIPFKAFTPQLRFFAQLIHYQFDSNDHTFPHKAIVKTLQEKYNNL